MAEVETPPPAKVQCTNGSSGDKKIKIGTHNGTFHCDEVMACYLLKLLPEYKDAEIVRSRDPAVLDACDIVVDVGGVFDAAKLRFDHHQRSFDESMHSLSAAKYPWKTKLSSAGLVYYHFGLRIFAHLLHSKPEHELVQILYKKVYENLIEEIDAVDNGIDVCSEGTPRYQITTTLSQRVGRCNPSWNQKDKNEWDGFNQALSLVKEEFLDRIHFYRDSWWPARSLVEASITNRFSVHPSGQIAVIEKGGCPWKDHLFSLEEERQIKGQILYLLYEDTSGQWRVQCVPEELGTFTNRKSLPEAWRGIRDEALSTLSGIEGCVFVHASGFIGGNKTREGAMKMAVKALEM